MQRERVHGSVLSQCRLVFLTLVIVPQLALMSLMTICHAFYFWKQLDTHTHTETQRHTDTQTHNHTHTTTHTQPHDHDPLVQPAAVWPWTHRDRRTFPEQEALGGA